MLYEQPKANTTDVQQKALARSLSLRAQQLRQDVDSVLKRTGLLSVDSFLSCSQRKHDGNVGVFFESTYCLPVAFCLEQTRKAFVEQSKCVTAMETMQVQCMHLLERSQDSDCCFSIVWPRWASMRTNSSCWR